MAGRLCKAALADEEGKALDGALATSNISVTKRNGPVRSDSDRYRCGNNVIRAIKLARRHGEPLPSWEAGAHIKVRLPDGNQRSYSLINTSLDPERPPVRTPTASACGWSSRARAARNSCTRSSSATSSRLEVTQQQFPAGAVVEANRAAGRRHRGDAGAVNGHGTCPGGRPYRFIYAGRARDQLAFWLRSKH